MRLFQRISHSTFYYVCRNRFFPFKTRPVTDDRDRVADGVPPVMFDWPAAVPKPRVGIIQDHGSSPRWTKYRRFLETNAFPFGIYDLHSSAWFSKAQEYDVVVGIDSCEASHLDEIRRKHYVLEMKMQKRCYPGYHDVVLYEDKILEAYMSEVYGLPFVKTYIFNSKEEALGAVDTLAYPLVSKVVPCSSSVGVELVTTPSRCQTIIRRAFSPRGRRTHIPYAAQKDYVYFQEYVPNDGYDIRIIVVGNKVFGYYRKVPEGDFRASGMGVVEKRELPAEAIQIARQAYDVVQGPMLVVDLLRSTAGKYFIIEMSPICRVDTPEQLHVAGKPGWYQCNEDSYVFEEGRVWVHELSLKEFLTRNCQLSKADELGRGKTRYLA